MIDEAQIPTYLPRKSTELATNVTPIDRAPVAVLSHFEAATELLRRGVALTAEMNKRIAEWHPAGVPETEIEQLQHRLTTRAGLRVVGE